MLIQGDRNPHADGVLLEMDFVMRLGNSTAEAPSIIPMTTITDGQVSFDSGKRVHSFCDSLDATTAPQHGDWFIPDFFNNGGYDAVQFNPETLRYVQVTRSKTHSFNLNWNQKFFNMFRDSLPDVHIALCEVFFVVPREIVKDFRPKDASGKLAHFNKSNFQVVGFQRVKVN